MDLDWNEGKLTQAKVRNISAEEGSVAIRYNEKTQLVTIDKGSELDITPSMFE